MNPILHVEIPVRDLARAITFYQHWLQVAVDEPILLHDCRMAYLPFADEAAGASMALVQGPTTSRPSTGAHLHRG
jgi:predicted enzyme related to lactoylglutathione lyase